LNHLDELETWMAAQKGVYDAASNVYTAERVTEAHAAAEAAAAQTAAQAAQTASVDAAFNAPKAGSLPQHLQMGPMDPFRGY
jgi:hypothetical protein